MSVHWDPVLKTAALAVVAPLGVYISFLALGATPFVQRHLLYLHKANTLWWRDVNEPELFGFAKGQVTPFWLTSPDGQSLYSWHITPLPVYLQNEEALSAQKSGVAPDITNTESFRRLKEDPEARVVIYLHGNAGDIAQGHRPDSYHALTDTSPYHVLTLDYRGFGHSSGTPSEHGLIQDAATLIDWVLNVAGIPSKRVVILGQSLGTAVASGVAELYAGQDIEFGGIILVAGFSNLQKMLSGYKMGGVLPVLGPLRVWSPLLRLVERFIWEKWQSADRLERLVRLTKGRLRLSLVAAVDDADIPCTESDKLFQSAAKATMEDELDQEAFAEWKESLTIRKRDNAFVTTLRAAPDTIIRQELFPYGGHNTIMGYAPVVLAVMRSFDLGGTVYDSNELE